MVLCNYFCSRNCRATSPHLDSLLLYLPLAPGGDYTTSPFSAPLECLVAEFFLQSKAEKKTLPLLPCICLFLLGPGSPASIFHPAIGLWLSLLTNKEPAGETDLSIRTAPFIILFIFCLYLLIFYLLVGSFYYPRRFRCYFFN